MQLFQNMRNNEKLFSSNFVVIVNETIIKRLKHPTTTATATATTTATATATATTTTTTTRLRQHFSGKGLFYYFVVFVRNGGDLFLHKRLLPERFWTMGIINPQVRKLKFSRSCILPRMFAPIWLTRKVALTFHLSPKETVYSRARFELEVMTRNPFFRSLKKSYQWQISNTTF